MLCCIFLARSSHTMSNDANPLAFSSADESQTQLQQTLEQHKQRLAQLSDADVLERAGLHYEMAEILLEVTENGREEKAWAYARDAFNSYCEAEQWDDAVRCCDVLFRTEQPAAVQALGNGIWLAVTYPIATDLSVLMLNHLIDATPADSDGAAVAAAVAHYLADIRLEGEKRESMMFLTSAMLGKVAERHSQIQSQEQMTMWMNRLQLLEPSVFLPRLAQILEAITENTWWYDRDALRAKLP